MRTKEEQDKYNRDRRERCKKLGICVSCNQPSPDKQRCTACSDKRREYHRAYSKGYNAGMRKLAEKVQEVIAA